MIQLERGYMFEGEWVEDNFGSLVKIKYPNETHRIIDFNKEDLFEKVSLYYEHSILENVEEKLKVAIDKGVNHYIQKLQELYNRDVVELENSDNLLDNSDLMIYIIEDLREGLRFFEELFKHKNLSNSTKDFERLNKNLQHRITKILSE